MHKREDSLQDRSQSGSEEAIDRRLLLARAVEIAAISPLAALGLNNALGHRDYATIDSDRAMREISGLNPQPQRLASHFDQLAAGLDSLYSAYRSEYHHSRVVPYVTVDSKGKTQIRHRTEYYWDEERSVPDHSVIEGWQYSVAQIRGKISELSSPELIDTEKVNQLLVKTRHVGNLSQIGGSILIAGAEIGALLGYEEVIGLRSHARTEHGEVIESKEQLRRGFFKTCAALFGGGAALLVADKINTRLASGKERMEQAVSQAKDESLVSATAGFNGHFNSTADGLISEIATQRRQVEQSLASGVSEQSVRSAMENYRKLCGGIEESLRIQFSDGPPDAIADLCKSAILTKTINSARSAESGLGESAVLIEGLAVGGAMAATVIALEIGNKYVPHKSES